MTKSTDYQQPVTKSSLCAVLYLSVLNLSQKIMPLVAQVCSAVICMPVLVFSMMQLEIYCQPAEPYDVYIKVCCRVTACWA